MQNYWSKVIGYRLWAIGLKPITHHLSPITRLFTSHISPLTVFILFTFHFSLFTEVHAAPHITGKKLEPVFPSRVGKHIKERMAARMHAPMLANATSGALKILFLRVDFPADDTNAQTTGNGNWTDPTYACDAPGSPTVIANDPVCNANPNDYWVNKAKDRFIAYYKEVSYNQLDIQVDVYPPIGANPPAYRLPNPMTFYGSNSCSGQECTSELENLIRDSVNTANAEPNPATNPAFNQYDAVLIVHAGAGEETDVLGNTPSDIWSLFYSVSTNIVNADGININEAIIMPQTGTQDGGTVDPLGIYAHEFGHWLGLPDLYDTKLFPTWDGVGKWSLMGDGIYLAGSDGISGSSPAHTDAWCKTYLGWVTPATYSATTDPGMVMSLPVETNQQIIKVPASTTTPSQYFLLENRQRTAGSYAFDYGLPGSGLLVWLIDDAVINANIGGNTVNNNPLRPGVALMEADGDSDLKTYGGDYGGPGDPFPGLTRNTSFTPYTNPSSETYTPAGFAWLYLGNISIDASNNVSLRIGFSPAVPANLAATHNSATVLSWTANTENDLASYKIYRNGSFLADTTQNQYTDTSSTSGDSYSVTAVDSNGYESAKSAIVTITFSTGGGGGGGGCFIATAAYGSYEAPYVRILREFRDRYLLKSFEFRVLSFEFEIPNIAGRTFVKFYYKVSPPIADFIRESEALRAVVRLLLLPLIGFAAFLVKTSLVQQLATLGTFFIIFKSFIVRRLRR